jgi:uncharacterized membrane protein YhaH (DUF805 family)
VEGQVGWTDLFWSAQGRVGRTPFWVAAALLLIPMALYETVGPTLHWLTGWLLYPLALYSGACVLSKRLHDRGRSGWWAALVLLALVAVWTNFRGLGSTVFILILAWAAIELGVMQSEPGANRFGPSPLAGEAA